MRKVIFILSISLFIISPVWAHDPAEHLPHADDPIKQEEHLAVFDLVTDETATHLAVKSGDWSDPAVWANHAVPENGARVIIEEGVAVVLDGVYTDQRLDWIRVDGNLKFNPDKDTGLKVVTIAVNTMGILDIGSAEHRVAADKTARVIFADRGERNRDYDPLDLSGGLVSHGQVHIYGAEKQSFVKINQKTTPPLKGVRVLELDSVPLNWKVGDQLLIPVVAFNQTQDFEATLAAINNNIITLSRPLELNHAGLGTVPVANLTRNVILESENKTDISRRGHTMFMHTQTGTVLDSAGFYGLGRTDTMRVHTMPELDEHGHTLLLTDANTMGRYAVHFHVRSGARRDVSPHIVRNCAVVGSPKHGIVNHGGHLWVEGSVVYKAAGSHFFAENGSEIGAFKNNLAIRSNGANIGLEDRKLDFDFGNAGHGFWMQGGGVDVIDNLAYGHSNAAFIFFGKPIVEGGKTIEFSAFNLEHPAVALGKAGVKINQVPFYFSGNEAVSSRSGFESWFMLLDPKHNMRSLLENSLFWGNKIQAMRIPYTENLDIKNTRGYGRSTTTVYSGISINSQTKNIMMDHVYLYGFYTGIEMPRQGKNTITESVLENKTNIVIKTATEDNRVNYIKDTVFGEQSDYAIVMVSEWDKKRFRVDELFKNDRTFLYTRNSEGDRQIQQVFYHEQYPTYVPLTNTRIVELDGKSNQQLWAEYQMAVGGQLAPDNGLFEPMIDGVLEPLVSDEVALNTLLSPVFTNKLLAYRLEVKDQDGVLHRSEPFSLAEGWNLLDFPINEEKQTFMVYGDITPPRFELDESVPFEINENYLHLGFEVHGKIFDLIEPLEEKEFEVQFERKFKNLSVTDDDEVLLDFNVADRAGNKKTVRFILDVVQ